MYDNSGGCNCDKESNNTNIKESHMKQPGIRIGNLQFGDMVEGVLSSVGITPERVTSWLGVPCGCKERQEKMNAWGAWLQQKLSGKMKDEDAKRHLDGIIEDWEDSKREEEMKQDANDRANNTEHRPSIPLR